MAKKPENGDSSPWKSREFLLVLFLLLALIITEGLVFWFLKDSADRGDFLALTFGAFGAWIGAGAAYFFGRENLRVATDSMLKIRGLSPTEMLAKTTLSAMKPRPLPKKVKKTDTVGGVLSWLEEDEKRFFLVVVNDADEFQYAIHEEAFYRFVNHEIDEKIKREKKAGAEGGEGEAEVEGFEGWHDKVKAKTVEEVIKYCEGEEKLKSLIEAAIKLNEDSTALLASQTMEQEKKFVTIVVDKENHPVGYITTGDIRRLLATSGQAGSQ